MKKLPVWLHSLGARMAMVIAVMSVILTLSIVAVIDIVATGPAQAEVGQSLSELAIQTSEKLDYGMFERYREIMLVAQRPTLRELTGSPEKHDELRAVINSLQTTYPYYAWIGLTDRDGKVLVATSGMLEGVDVSKRPWFSDAFNAINVGDVHLAKLLAAKLPPSERYPNDPKRFVDVAFPVSDHHGKIHGILGAHMSWDWAKDISRSIIDPLAMRRHVDLMILSKDGTVLLGPEQLIDKKLPVENYRKASGNQSGFIEETSENGERYLTGFSVGQGYQNYLGLGWTVLVRQPLAEAYAPIRAVQKPVMILGGLVTLVFCCIGALISREVTRPLVRLAESARRVATGSSDKLDEINTRYPELQDLAGSFGRMLTSIRLSEVTLRGLNQTLERRVADRTRQLEASQERLQVITDNVPALIALSNHERHFVFCNKAYMDWIGKDRDGVVGKHASEVLGPETYEAVAPHIDRVLTGKEVRFENMRMKDGQPYYREVCYIPTIEADGQITGFYVLAYDITDRKRAHLALEHDVLHDALTGLPNRRALMTHIEQARGRSRRNGKAYAVLFLDIDRFKHINDAYGHSVGDDVLIGFAARLKSAVRETDMVARLSGDEFVILAENLQSGEADAQHVAGKILLALAEPLGVGDRTIPVATSIGIAVADATRLQPADELIEQADVGMYCAKQCGRSRYHVATIADLMTARAGAVVHQEGRSHSAVLEHSEDSR